MKKINLKLFLLISAAGLFIVWAIAYLDLKNIEPRLPASLIRPENLSQGNKKPSSNNLIRCLSKKEIKVYGFSQDPDTRKQKEILGKAIKYFKYIECLEPESKQLTLKCQIKEIKNFPTWEFPDKKRKVGILSLKELAELSGCEL